MRTFLKIVSSFYLKCLYLSLGGHHNHNHHHHHGNVGFGGLPSYHDHHNHRRHSSGDRVIVIGGPHVPNYTPVYVPTHTRHSHGYVKLVSNLIMKSF